MEAQHGLPRPASVEDLALQYFGAGAGGFRLGRSPSEAEFTAFLNSGAMSVEGESPSMGMHRVASIDMLRRLIMTQQAVMASAEGGVVSHEAQHALAAAAGLGGVALAGAPLLAPTGVPVFYPPPVLPDWGKVLSGRAQETSLPVPQPGRQAKQPPVKKESARAKAARERAAALKAQKGARDEEDEEDADEEEEMDEAEVLKTMGKGSFTAEEIRRQRRMLSNRESARRSRRRKLEHVHTLQGQINVLHAEAASLVDRLRETEHRCEGALRENVGLKAEVERLTSALRSGEGGGSLLGRSLDRVASLPRIASAEHIVKRLREGDGEAVPAGGGSGGGFVPFRSLRSYENLLQLQAAAGGAAAAV